jgi:type III restriction enzyme
LESWPTASRGPEGPQSQGTGIKYQRLGDSQYYAQELFEREELTGYLKNLLNADKAAYEQVVYDSDTERTFADQLEKNNVIKVYAKLPGWFTVPTPLGAYNPDWAVLLEKSGQERLYFVVGTKSGLFADDLRERERAKVECGKAHFRALAVGESPALYVVARTLDDVLIDAALE